MGIIFSRWRKKQCLGEILESIEKDIGTLESSQQRTEQLRKKFIGSLILYSVLVYIVGALVCYFYEFPKSWKAKLVRSIPLLVFPFVVYVFKRVLHYVFVSRMTKNARRLEELKERKRQVLEEVMETETYKAAKDLLDKYDPNSELVRVEKKDLPSSPKPSSEPQSPSGTLGTELRQRNVSLNSDPSGAPLQRTVSEPSLAESPAQQPQSAEDHSGDHGLKGQPNDTVEPRKANSLVNLSGASPGTASPIQHGRPCPPGSPGPPRPIQPILPRERTAVDKVIEYLVGDGPNNRYALICKQCCSHNGMALKEEFEYTAFRCCYCYHLNPARKQRPTAPKLDYDTWSSPKSSVGQTSGLRHRKPTNSVQAMLEHKHTQKGEGTASVNGTIEMNGDHRKDDKKKEDEKLSSATFGEKEKVEIGSQEP